MLIVVSVARYRVASSAVRTCGAFSVMTSTNSCVVVVELSHSLASLRRSCCAASGSSKLHHEISLNGAWAYTEKGRTPGIFSRSYSSNRPAGRAAFVQ